MENNKISVLGSANYDTFLKIDRAPEVGETISSNELIQACGGKGANQAAAIGKLGFAVDFIGQVGKDSTGSIIINELKAYNVNTKHIKLLDNQPTGQAFIFSYPSKDNSIVIVGGANMSWEDNNLDGLKKSLENCMQIY
jgi:ribokinase